METIVEFNGMNDQAILNWCNQWPAMGRYVANITDLYAYRGSTEVFVKIIDTGDGDKVAGVSLIEREVLLHAQTSAAGFYQRAGFSTRGPQFEEAGIAHVAEPPERLREVAAALDVEHALRLAGAAFGNEFDAGEGGAGAAERGGWAGEINLNVQSKEW